MSSPLRTAWASPWVRRPVKLGVAVAVLIAGSVIIINLLGAQAWQKAEARMAAEGETADYRKLLSPPVPDAENFCAAPSLYNIAVSEKDTSAAAQEGRL